MEKQRKHGIKLASSRSGIVGVAIGIDLGNAWSHFCILDGRGEIVEEGRFRNIDTVIERLFGDMAPARIAMEAGTRSIWVAEQLRKYAHDVVVAGAGELQVMSNTTRKSDRINAEKLARYARMGPEDHVNRYTWGRFYALGR